MMIAMRLMGGLGNQFFQYAFGRQMAHRLGVPLHLDLRWFDTMRPGATPRAYQLAQYPIKAVVAAPRSLPRFTETWVDKIWRSWFPPLKVYERHQPGFHADAVFPRDNTLYVGYWQSESYFPDVASAIREELTLPTPPTGRNAEYAAMLRDGTAISLHVRRGDYASNSRTNAVHGIISLDYYRAAMAYIEKRAPRTRIFVFSDDLDWCTANLPVGNDAVFVGGNDEASAFEDLRLMSLCQHHIIANSSFSWWGAWLNASPGKLVVAPQHWFADAKMDAIDMIPSSWVRV